ncbi:MAG: T9SS type A sorting domain-containing protein [candidate division WOR-3 bacterium]
MKNTILFLAVGILLAGPAQSQFLDTLYIPDTLGGCGEFDDILFNPVMNRLYIISHNNAVVLDCATKTRLKPLRNITGPVIFNPDNNSLYMGSIVLPSDTAVNLYVINCSTQAIVDTITLPTGGLRPRSGSNVRLNISIPANKIYCTVWFYESEPVTYVIDCRNNEVIKEMPGLHWRTVFHSLRSCAYICTQTAIYYFDCTNDTITDSISAPPNLGYQNISLSSESERLFATATSSQTTQIEIIDCLTNQVLGELQLPTGCWWLVHNTSANKLYAGVPSHWPNDLIYIIDLNTVQLTDSLLFPRSSLRDLFYNPNTDHLYTISLNPEPPPIAWVRVFDGETNSLIEEIPVPGHLNGGYIFHPTANRLYLNDGTNLFIIDCNRRQLETCLKIGYINSHIMWQPVTNRLYINDIYGDSFSSILTVYDASTNLPLKVVDLSSRVPSEEWFFHFTTATRENKIYLTSAQYRGVYVLDGETDSLINFIPGYIGGHYLLYSSRRNKLYTIPFSELMRNYYIYIIDCENDEIKNVIDVGESGDGYVNPYTDKVYAAITYMPSGLKTFIIDGEGDTVIKVIDSIGRPLAFRNKGDIHQIYMGCPYQDRVYVLDAKADTVIDSVMDVPITSEPFFYYDSIDDRIYYPHSSGGIIVIDCAANQIMDTILFCGIRYGHFLEECLWNPISDRFYLPNYDTSLTQTRNPMIMVIDCRTNTIIDSFYSPIKPEIMQWNYINNVVYINDYRYARVVAVKDNLIGVQDKPANETKPKMVLISPSVGSRFIVQQRAKGEIKIVDACGRIVKNLKPNQNTLDARNLAPGIYFATIEEHSRTLVQKFTVIR